MSFEFKKEYVVKEKPVSRPPYAYTSICPDKDKTYSVKKFTKLSIKK